MLPVLLGPPQMGQTDLCGPDAAESRWCVTLVKAVTGRWGHEHTPVGKGMFFTTTHLPLPAE